MYALMYISLALVVYSRTGFLKTLEDTLGFHPKVGSNAFVHTKRRYYIYSHYAVHHFVDRLTLMPE